MEIVRDPTTGEYVFTTIAVNFTERLCIPYISWMILQTMKFYLSFRGQDPRVFTESPSYEDIYCSLEYIHHVPYDNVSNLLISFHDTYGNSVDVIVCPHFLVDSLVIDHPYGPYW